MALSWALGVSVQALAPDWGEPWLLRWARALGEHPVRTALALWLGLWALRPARRDRAAQGDAGQSFEESL